MLDARVGCSVTAQLGLCFLHMQKCRFSHDAAQLIVMLVIFNSDQTRDSTEKTIGRVSFPNR